MVGLQGQVLSRVTLASLGGVTAPVSTDRWGTVGVGGFSPTETTQPASGGQEKSELRALPGDGETRRCGAIAGPLPGQAHTAWLVNVARWTGTWARAGALHVPISPSPAPTGCQ